ATHSRPVRVHRCILDLVVQIDVPGRIATRMRQIATPRIEVVVGDLVCIAGAAIGTGHHGQGTACDATAQADLHRIGVGLHEAGVGHGVAGGHLVGADARLCHRTGCHRGCERVLLLVVVARGDVHADVARGTAEGIATEAGGVGDAGVHGGVAEAGLV